VLAWAAFKRSSIFPRVPPTEASKNEAYKNRMPPANHQGKSHQHAARIPNRSQFAFSPTGNRNAYYRYDGQKPQIALSAMYARNVARNQNAH